MQMVYAGAIVGLSFGGLALVGMSMPGLSAVTASQTEVKIVDASASALPAPGDLRLVAGDGRSKTLDLAALDAMSQESFVTDTIWTDAPQRYSGVPLAALLEAVGVEVVDAPPGARIELTALNDYRVQFPLEEVGPRVPIIATRIDGKTVSIRDKGPYWLVYPYDSSAEYRLEEIYKRSVWQLAQIVVLE